MTRTRTWLFRTAAAVAAACLLAAPALAAVTVTGDRAAYDEVIAAFRKLFSLSGYRMKLVVEGSSETVMEMAPPNGMHATGHGSNVNVEIVSLNGKTAMKLDGPGAPPGWRCVPAVPKLVTMPDPQKGLQEGTGTINVSRGPDTNIEGTPVHTYISDGSDGEKDTIYVGSQTGLPRRILSESTAHHSTVDYYDYGANIVITLPAECGQ